MDAKMKSETTVCSLYCYRIFMFINRIGFRV